MTEKWNYKALIENFKNEGYRSVFFHELKPEPRQVILRHDVDFDCKLAAEMAKAEADLGVFSTYFFLLSAPFYNLIKKENATLVNEIKSMGHEISLHFDPTQHDDALKGLAREVKIFETWFNVPVRIVSFHRPASFTDDWKQVFQNIKHTYLPEFSQDITYISDSTGTWRYGHVLESEAFKQRQSIQLLTHPIWWYSHGHTNNEKLLSYYKNYIDYQKEHFLSNSNVFKSIYDEITR